MQIRNTGTESIRKGDFAAPISITAPGGRVVDCTVRLKSVPNIYADGSISENGPAKTQSFTPELMNPGDWIDLVILTDGTRDNPVLTCWIDGETRPMRQAPSPTELLKRRLRFSRSVTLSLAISSPLSTLCYL